MSKQTELKWHTEVRKVSELIPYDKNPRKLNEKQMADLKASLAKFNLMSIPVINTDNKLVSGHQRMMILKLLGRGEEEIECRVPNRTLTEAEFKEANLRENKNVGDWDWSILGSFSEDILTTSGFEAHEIDLVNSLKTTEMPTIEDEAILNAGDMDVAGGKPEYIVITFEDKEYCDSVRGLFGLGEKGRVAKFDEIKDKVVFKL